MTSASLPSIWSPSSGASVPIPTKPVDLKVIILEVAGAVVPIFKKSSVLSRPQD